jgi:hypothetical protein
MAPDLLELVMPTFSGYGDRYSMTPSLLILSGLCSGDIVALTADGDHDQLTMTDRRWRDYDLTDHRPA